LDAFVLLQMHKLLLYKFWCKQDFQILFVKVVVLCVNLFIVVEPANLLALVTVFPSLLHLNAVGERMMETVHQNLDLDLLPQLYLQLVSTKIFIPV
jgi:hypothetical protein